MGVYLLRLPDEVWANARYVPCHVTEVFSRVYHHLSNYVRRLESSRGRERKASHMLTSNSRLSWSVSVAHVAERVFSVAMLSHGSRSPWMRDLITRRGV